MKSGRNLTPKMHEVLAIAKKDSFRWNVLMKFCFIAAFILKRSVWKGTSFAFICLIQSGKEPFISVTIRVPQ